MKKKIAILGACMLLTLPAAIVSAGQSSTTSVSYKVDPAYEVTIPSHASVVYNQRETYFGKIRVEKAVLDENQCIKVTMASDGVLVNQKNSKDVIPYQILSDNKEFTGQTYTKTGQETDLMIRIGQDAWRQAAGGYYKTSISFTVSCVNK